MNNAALFIESFMKQISKNVWGLKFYQTLVVTFMKVVSANDKNDSDVEAEKDDFGVEHYAKRTTAHFHSKTLLTTKEFKLKQVVNSLTIQQITKKIRQWILGDLDGELNQLIIII